MALSRKVLNGQARLMAYNVTQFMRKEAEEGMQIERKAAQKRAAAATGIKLTTLRRIVKEGKVTESVFRTPGKKRPRQNTVTGLDTKSHALLKKIIHNFHITDNELPSTHLLIKKLKEQNIFHGSRTSLRNLLKKLGFQWKKSKKNRRKLLIESSKVRLKRVEYLQAIASYRAEGRPIVYTDEFFIQSPQCFSPSAISSVNKVHGFQMLLAGSEDNLISNTLLMLEADSKADLNNEILNHEQYENWVRHYLMPNLPPHSVVVVDDAPYHNKYEDEAPGSIANRSEMEAWLIKKGINFSSTMLKPQLYSLISVYKEKLKNYNLDRILCENNHTVLRLPPNHLEFNPMAMAWDEVRAYISTAVDESKWAQSATTLVKDKLKKMKELEWKTLCLEVHKTEEEFMQNDLEIDRFTEDISLEETGGGSGSEEGSSEHEDSEGSDDDDDTSDFAPSSTLQPSTAFVAKDKVPSLENNQGDYRIREIVNNIYKYLDLCLIKNNKLIYVGQGGRLQIMKEVAEATGIGMQTVSELLDLNDDTDALSRKEWTLKNKVNNPRNSEILKDCESTENPDALGTKRKVLQRAGFKYPRFASCIIPAQKHTMKKVLQKGESNHNQFEITANKDASTNKIDLRKIPQGSNDNSLQFTPRKTPPEASQFNISNTLKNTKSIAVPKAPVYITRLHHNLSEITANKDSSTNKIVSEPQIHLRKIPQSSNNNSLEHTTRKSPPESSQFNISNSLKNTKSVAVTKAPVVITRLVVNKGPKTGNIVEICNLQKPNILEKRSKGPPVVITRLKRPKSVETIDSLKIITDSTVKEELVDSENDVKLEVVEFPCEYLTNIKTETNEDHDICTSMDWVV